MEWVQGDYGFQHATAGDAHLSVGWDTVRKKGTAGGYVASVSISTRRTKIIGSQDEAKAIIEKALRIMCERILEKLKENNDGN